MEGLEMGTWITVVILGLLAASEQDDASKASEDLKLLQGAWHGVSLEVAGVAAPEEFAKKGKYVFKDDVLTMFEGDKQVGRAKVAIDPSTTPKGIDLTALDAPDKGKSVRGIFKIEGDTLTLCFGKEQRPTEFTGKGMAGLAKFKRPAE